MIADQAYVFFLSTPTAKQTRWAGLVASALILVLLTTIPFARDALAGSANFLPIYATAVLINDLITSIMLLTIFSVHRSWAIFILSMAYLFTALTVIPWVLTFPGAAIGSWLLDAPLQSTAMIAAVRLYSFPLLVMIYVAFKDRAPSASAGVVSLRRIVGWGVALVVGLTVGLTWCILRFERWLPALMVNETRSSALWRVVLIGGMLTMAAAFASVSMRFRSKLDLWLLVVLLAMFIERLLLGFLSAGRLSLGWWAGRLYGLGAASIVLIVLLYEMTSLYSRLVQAVSTERRGREARLMTMQALSGSIAHEINQPLASMVTNAEAGLRWLERGTPDLDEAGAALRRIASDGRRAGEVISNIRAVFRKGTAEQVSVDLNALTAGILAELEPELRPYRVQVRAEFDPRLPAVIGNPVQLQQVVANLVRNAAEAMSLVKGSRVIRIGTERQDPGVLLSVEDTGPGLDPRHAGQVFEAVFTTKPDGIGMGLVICRTIVEAHGGRIWVDSSRAGTRFRFSLPV